MKSFRREDREGDHKLTFNPTLDRFEWKEEPNFRIGVERVVVLLVLEGRRDEILGVDVKVEVLGRKGRTRLRSVFERVACVDLCLGSILLPSSMIT